VSRKVDECKPLKLDETPEYNDSLDHDKDTSLCATRTWTTSTCAPT
jgi:hypothetical protein